jgi:hypothetical protein
MCRKTEPVFVYRELALSVWQVGGDVRSRLRTIDALDAVMARREDVDSRLMRPLAWRRAAFID